MTASDLRVILLGLAVVCLISGAAFLGQSLAAGRHVPDRAYGVQYQEGRKKRLVGLIRAAAAGLLGLILLVMFTLSGNELVDNRAPQVTNISDRTPTPSTEPSPSKESTVPGATAVITATDTLDTATPTALVTAAPSPTSLAQIALVSSPVGLWLREAPAGSREVELIPDGARLTLLPGRETADGLEWLNVRTEAGNEGWVAAEFVVIQ